MVLVIERENEMSKSKISLKKKTKNNNNNKKISFGNLISCRLALICFELLNPGVY